MEYSKSVKLIEEFESLDKYLLSLANFELKIELIFQSKVLPLAKYFAPSDKIRILKRGDSIRCDYNIVKFKGISTKKTPTSLIYNPLNIDPSLARGSNKLYILKHKKKSYTRPLRKISPEEKQIVMEGIFKQESIRDKYQISSLQDIHRTTSRTKTINGHKCSR